MYVGITNGTGFKGTVNYDTDLNSKNHKDVNIISIKGVDRKNRESVIRSFRIQSMLNPRIKKCVKHIWLSYKPEDELIMINNALKNKAYYSTMEEAVTELGKKAIDKIINKAMASDAQIFLQKIGYDNTQFVITRHKEKNNPHCHIILNVVDNEGKHLRDFQEIKRGQKICKNITISQRYTWGDNKSISKSDINKPKEKIRYEMAKELRDMTYMGLTAQGFKQEAAKKGINVIYRINSKNKIVGITYESKEKFYNKEGHMVNYKVAAKELDRTLSARVLFPPQEIEAPIIQEDDCKYANEMVHPAANPDVPAEIKAAEAKRKIKNEYISAIKYTADRDDAAHVACVTALALDPAAGTVTERSVAVAPYITGQNKVNSIGSSIQESKGMTLFDKMMDFLRQLFDNGLCLASVYTNDGVKAICPHTTSRTSEITLPELAGKIVGEMTQPTKEHPSIKKSGLKL